MLSSLQIPFQVVTLHLCLTLIGIRSEIISSHALMIRLYRCFCDTVKLLLRLEDPKLIVGVATSDGLCYVSAAEKTMLCVFEAPWNFKDAKHLWIAQMGTVTVGTPIQINYVGYSVQLDLPHMC